MYGTSYWASFAAIEDLTPFAKLQVLNHTEREERVLPRTLKGLILDELNFVKPTPPKVASTEA